MQKPANLLLTLMVVFVGVSAWLSYKVDDSYAPLLPVALVLGMLVYILAPQINWWWWQRNAPDLDSVLKDMLDKQLPLYSALSAERKSEFRRRLFLFMEAQEYMPQGFETVTPDMKMMLAVAPVAMTLHRQDFLFPDFEHIVLYLHPFPSPEHPEHFHASEIYPPDGVAMFCTEHVARGFMQPSQYFNPAWYEYAKIARLAHSDWPFATLTPLEWEDLEAISGFSKPAMERWIGLPDLDKDALAIAYFFVFPVTFREKHPSIFHALNDYFNIH